MDLPWNGNTILTEFVSNVLKLKEGVIHFAKLLIGFSVVGPGPAGLFNPLMAVFTLIVVLAVYNRCIGKLKRLTRPVV